jgi:hypothetical protein
MSWGILLEVTEFGESKQSVAPHLPTDTCKIDPELAAIAEAWPNLPEAVKASILMLVKAASDKWAK